MATDAGAPINTSDFAADVDDLNTRMGVAEPALSAVEAHVDAIESAMVPKLEGVDPFTAFKWQGNSDVVLLDSSGRATITFGVPFDTGCLTAVACNGDTATIVFECGLAGSPSASSFTVECSIPDPTATVPLVYVPLSSTVVRINWFAIGS